MITVAPRLSASRMTALSLIAITFFAECILPVDYDGAFHWTTIHRWLIESESTPKSMRFTLMTSLVSLMIFGAITYQDKTKILLQSQQVLSQLLTQQSDDAVWLKQCSMRFRVHCWVRKQLFKFQRRRRTIWTEICRTVCTLSDIMLWILTCAIQVLSPTIVTIDIYMQQLEMEVKRNCCVVRNQRTLQEVWSMYETKANQTPAKKRRASLTSKQI